MGDRLGTPGVVGFWYDSLFDRSLKQRTSGTIFFLDVRKHDSAIL